jgi:hypothetical protein
VGEAETEKYRQQHDVDRHAHDEEKRKNLRICEAIEKREGDLQGERHHDRHPERGRSPLPTHLQPVLVPELVPSGREPAEGGVSCLFRNESHEQTSSADHFRL